MPSTFYSIINRYEDVPRNSITGYKLVAVAADKLKCIARRGRARDFYDLDKLLTEKKITIDEAWELYIKTWNSPSREYGKRPHPAEIRGSYLGRKERLEQDWESLVSSKMFSHPESFHIVFQRLDKTIDEVLKKWKSELPRGVLHAERKQNILRDH